MKLRVAFIHYDDDPTIMPNAMVISDNYMEDAHNGTPKFYLDEVAKLRASSNGTVREAVIEIPDAAVEALFEVPRIGAMGMEPS